jgi:hypothetical protein
VSVVELAGRYCASCGARLWSGSRADRRYCSAACRRRASRARLELEDAARAVEALAEVAADVGPAGLERAAAVLRELARPTV